MPPPSRPIYKQRYTQEDVEKALDAIKNYGYSISAAARAYEVPKTTLYDKLKGKYKENAPIGRPAVLSDEEESHIVQWALDVAKAGFPVTKDQLVESVARLMKDLNRQTPFKNNVPGDKWFNLFLGRHPEIAKRVSQALTSSRANVTEGDIRAWFGKVKGYLESKGLLNIFLDPRRIFNADETAFFLCPKGKTVLARKGEKAVYQQTGNDKKECLTVLVNANAAGEMAPPMVVFKYERVPPAIVRTFPADWGLGKSKNGWMTREAFFEYIANIFHPWLQSKNITFPIVLFIDGHTSYMSFHLSTYCSQNGIEVIALYPNSTHLLQPLDVAVFRPLKTQWKTCVNDWRFRHDGRRMKREEFSPLLKTVLDNLDAKVVVNGFKATGLDTLDPEKVHYNLILKKTTTPAKTNNMKRKAEEIRSYLSYFEVKMGLEKVQKLARGEIEVEDQSLFQVWNSIKNELATLKSEIAASEKENEPPFVPSTTSTPVPKRPSALTPAEEEIVDDALSFPIDFDEDGSDQARIVEGRIVADGNSSVDEQGLQNIIDSLGFTNADQGISIEVSVTDILESMPESNVPEQPDPELLRELPSENNQPSCSQTETTSSAGMPLPGTYTTPSKCCTSISMPSPFKRCLQYPSPTSIKKKIKKRDPTPAAITGESYRQIMAEREAKKREKEEEKEQRRMIREVKKTIKQEGSNNKRPTTAPDDSDSDSQDEEIPIVAPKDLENLMVNSWVVVPYDVEGKRQYFPGQIKSITNDRAGIKFLCRKGNKFIWPDEDDFDNDVPLTDIVQILSAPAVERRGFFSFKEKVMS